MRSVFGAGPNILLEDIRETVGSNYLLSEFPHF